MPELNPGVIFTWTFFLSALAGLAAVMKPGKDGAMPRELSYRLCISSALNSGLFGTATAMLWWDYFDGPKQPWAMLGVSMFCGLGGVHLLDACLATLQDVFRLAVVNFASKIGQAAQKQLRDSLPDIPALPDDRPETPNPPDATERHES